MKIIVLMTIKMKRKVIKTVLNMKKKVKKVIMDMIKTIMVKMDNMIMKVSMNKVSIIVNIYSQVKYSFGKLFFWLYVQICLYSFDRLWSVLFRYGRRSSFNQQIITQNDAS